MMKLIGAALAVGFSAVPALGQGAGCGFAPDIEAALSERYGEHMAGAGVGAGGGSWTALYVNPETGSWTILQVTPNGIGCIRAAGEGWQFHDAPPQGEEG